MQMASSAANASEGINGAQDAEQPEDPYLHDLLEVGLRTWQETYGWSERDAEIMVAAASMMRAQQIILNAADQVLRPLNLTFSRYEVLGLLDTAVDGTMLFRDLSKRLLVHPASITNSVDRLESAGLVRRRPHPTDRRALLAEITPAGRKSHKAAQKVLVKLAFGIDVLEHDDLIALITIIRKLRTDAGDFG
jgi:DNA-binding MarR family transcriptional regulator